MSLCQASQQWSTITSSNASTRDANKSSRINWQATN